MFCEFKGVLYSCIFLSFFAFTPGAHALHQEFTLKDAIQYSLTHSPKLDNSRRELNIAEAEDSNAFSRFLPSLDLNTTNGLQKTSPSTTSNNWSSQLSLGLTENLYDNGTSITQYRITSLKRQQADISFKEDRDQLCLDVTASYYQLSLERKRLDIQQTQHALLKKQFDKVANRYQQGMTTRKDFIRFQTQLRRAEIDLITTQNNIQKTEKDLLRLLGIQTESASSLEISFQPDPPTELDVSKIPATPPDTEKHYVSRIAKTKREIDSLSVDLVRRKYWPEVFLTSSATYSNAGYLGGSSPFTSTDSLGWNALVTLKYNFWDWGIRRREIDIAEQREQIQNNDLNSGILSVGSDISKLMLDLKQLQENYKLSNELLGLEQTNYNFLQDEYQQGRLAYLDLITGLNNLSDAKIIYFSALFALKKALATYRFHEGTLYDSIFSQ